MLLTIIDTTFQSLPPEPVEEVKSKVNEVQRSICEGAEISTAGGIVIAESTGITTAGTKLVGE